MGVRRDVNVLQLDVSVGKTTVTVVLAANALAAATYLKK